MSIQIQDKAYEGSLTLSQAKQYFSDNPSHLNAIGGNINLTPLCAACHGGHLDVVKHLLTCGADPNVPSDYERTPLFFITDPRCKASSAIRCAIIRELVSGRGEPKPDPGNPGDDDMNTGKGGLKANLDKPCDDDMNTPLMNAITQLKDKEVIEQLVESGASTTIRHYLDQPTAEELGEEHGFAGSLISKAKRNKDWGEMIDLLVTFVLLVIAYVNNKTVNRVVGGVVKKYYDISVKEGDIPKVGT